MRLNDAIHWNDAGLSSRYLVPFVLVSASVLVQIFVYVTFTLHFPRSDQMDLLVSDLALWTAFGAIAAVWSTARARLWVGDRSGAGFPVAILGLLCRARGVLFAGMMGPIDLAGRSEAADSLPFLFSFHRDGGLFAFGLGLGLVVFSSIADFRSRRDGPAWIFPRT